MHLAGRNGRTAPVRNVGAAGRGPAKAGGPLKVLAALDAVDEIRKFNAAQAAKVDYIQKMVDAVDDPAQRSARVVAY